MLKEAMLRPGDVLDGKYEILKEIGHGGMSTVYLAMDRHLNKQWAIKEIRKKGNGRRDEIAFNRLLAEADLMKRLDHPALPRIVDIHDNGSTICIIMDYIEGESLDKVQKSYGRLPEKQVIGWARQLCDALSYLHSQKPPIIYRDMKPGNIMLKPEGNIKIIDFGIAREYKPYHQQDTVILGTRGYAPPEQYCGQTDARSDIFALGMTMHQLLTGVSPAEGQPYMPVRAWNPQLSEGIEAIIDRCVQPAPENRYQTCADLLYDLEHPELVSGDYKKKEKNRLRLFILACALTLFSLTAGIVTYALAVRTNDQTYENLITPASGTALEDKLAAYAAAIEIYPDRQDAYLGMLEAFEEEGHFNRTDSDRFLALYNAHKAALDPGTPETAELNYRIGRMYFNYYTEADGSADLAARVQKAYSFFEANYEYGDLLADFEARELSDSYYRVCVFYRKYIFRSSSVEEARAEDYEALMADVTELLETLSSDREANAYDQLVISHGILTLLYDQRTALARTGTDEETVLNLFDRICRESGALMVNKTQSARLQEEISACAGTYREAILRAYSNAGLSEEETE